jgi:hypothetical protein
MVALTRSKYKKNGYKPDFDKLPLEDKYRPHRRSWMIANGPTGKSDDGPDKMLRRISCCEARPRCLSTA